MIQRKRLHVALLTLLILFGLLFVWRGPVRGITGGQDLAHLYVASTLWLEGGNPYDGEQCVACLDRAGHADPQIVRYGSYYPPPTIASLVPLGLVDWETTRLIWLVLSLFATGAMAWALAQWAEIDDTVTRWLAVLLLVFAWGAVATSLSLGQLSLVSAACLLVGVVLLDRGRAWSAGLLIGLGCLIKPQLGIGFLVLLGLRRHWLSLGVSAGLIAVVTAMGVGRLMVTVPDWAETLAGNYSATSLAGQAIDASVGSVFRHHMIDGRVLLHLIVPSEWVNLATIGFVAMLAGLAILRLFRLGLRSHTLLSVAGVGLLLMLPVYHRYYDAVLVLPLLVLVLNQLKRRPSDWVMIAIGLLLLPLFAPLPAFLVGLEAREWIPAGLQYSWVWQHVIRVHQPWCLSLAALLLVYWTWRLPVDDAPADQAGRS